jgi:effector-binding domain-containing protein
LIILIILGEEYKLLSSSLCNFLHSPVTFSVSHSIFMLFWHNNYKINSTYMNSNKCVIWKVQLWKGKKLKIYEVMASMKLLRTNHKPNYGMAETSRTNWNFNYFLHLIRSLQKVLSFAERA